jgi:asparagine synthase (glutamine-hydrolysing)
MTNDKAEAWNGISGSDDGLRDADASRTDWREPAWSHAWCEFEPRHFPEYFERAIFAYGQPSAMTSLPLCYALAKTAHEHGVVVLISGEGADELFLGYPSYAGLLDPRKREVQVKRLKQFYLPRRREAVLRRLLGDAPVHHCRAKLAEFIEGIAPLPPRLQLWECENKLSLQPLLARTDAAFMQFAVEGRVPFLHGDVPQLALAVPTRRLIDEAGGKQPLQAIASLHRGLRVRPKEAFRLPIREWFAGPLRRWLHDLLDGHASLLAGLGVARSATDELLAALSAGDRESARAAYLLAGLCLVASSEIRHAE